MPTTDDYHYSHTGTLSLGSFEGSGYGSPESSRSNSIQWKPPPPPPGVGNGHFDDFNFGTSLQQTADRPIGLNTRVRSHDQDVVGQHLLYETALLDTQDYKILDIGEVDELKKEYARLNTRIDAANRKLALESKVKNAAQNLQKLNATKKSGRPDTPQSPDSPRKGRNRNGSLADPAAQAANDQADEELAHSIKLVDELNESIKSLVERRQVVERQLLRHTAAVLADQAQRNPEPVDSVLSNGARDDDDDDGMAYEPNEFDGIRDILRGAPAGSSKMKHAEMERLQADHEHTLQNLQDRLEQLNSQLRRVITEASESHGKPLRPEIDLGRAEDSTTTLYNTMRRLESNLEALEDDHADAMATGNNASQALQDVESKAAASAQRASEYETVLSGLWEILTSGSLTPRGSIDERGSMPPRSPLKEDFSLQAFSSRVQHVYDVATSAREQQEILRRQIQQQRDLNGKSDMEKDTEIEQWQSKHNDLARSHQLLEEDLAKAMVNHQQAEREATENRGELVNVMNELEQLKRTMDARMQERDEVARQLEAHRGTANGLQDHVESLEAQIADLTEKQQEMETLESDVVRLTTELTIAKADLEGAYGTRAERQKEAGLKASEIGALKEKHQQATDELSSLRTKHIDLQEHAESVRTELSEMTNEFQAMTRESLELEKERGQLEGLIDGLRDRCDALEAQLSDEKVRWMGIKSPGDGPDSGAVREVMSVSVLRQEFKRMMREARAEGVKLIRAEQEERRKLEAELRKHRQANGPLGRRLAPNPQTSTTNAPSNRPQTPMSLSPAPTVA